MARNDWQILCTVVGYAALAITWYVKSFVIDINKSETDYFNYQFGEYKRTMNEISGEETKSSVLFIAGRTIPMTDTTNNKELAHNTLANQGAWTLRHIEAWHHLKLMHYGSKKYDVYLDSAANYEGQVRDWYYVSKGIDSMVRLNEYFQKWIERNSTPIITECLARNTRLTKQIDNWTDWLKYILAFGTGLVTFAKILDWLEKKREKKKTQQSPRQRSTR